MTVESIIEAIHQAYIRDIQITVANYNIHSFNLSMQLPWFYEFLQGAEIAHCDGFGILKGLSYMGLDLPFDYRVSYTVLMPQLFEHCQKHGLSVFLLGSKSEYLKRALSNIKQQYPKLNIDGHHGYFERDNPLENQAVIGKINRIAPNVLLIGMGMPIQEDWVSKHRHELDVNAFLTGGAVIDRLAGVLTDSPSWISHAGLEWLYRLCQEPKRLASRYLIGNLAFAFNLILAKHNQFSPLEVNKIDSDEQSSLTLGRMGKHLWNIY